jgi:amino acid adenylation domain-containing protein
MNDPTQNKLDAMRQELLLRKLKKSAVPRQPVTQAAGIERIGRDQPLALSWSQQRLWFIEQLEGEGSAYHIPGALRLHGALDCAALQAALDAIVVRHEILRTVILTENGEPRQDIRSAQSSRFVLRHLDLSALARDASFTADRREAELQRQIEAEIEAPFDLTTGPLIRGLLIASTPDEHVLVIVMHHIVSDGWSIGILIRELITFYGASCQSLPLEQILPALPVQYADYAHWQRRWLTGPTLQNQLDYWQQALAGIPLLLELPTDRPRPPVQSHVGRSQRITLDRQLSLSLRQLARQNDATLFMVLYAAWALLLARLSGQNDLVIGVPVANRQRTELEGLIGFFVNTLPLRFTFDPTEDVSALLARVKALTLAAYAHQDAPFEQVVEALNPPRSRSHTPIFQVMFALQNAPAGELELPGIRLSAQSYTQHVAQFDLSLVLHETGELIEGDLTHASDLFDASTIARWSEYYLCLLRGLCGLYGSCATVAVDGRAGQVGRLPLMEAAERHQLLHDFGAQQQRWPQTDTLPERFERIAAQHGARIAVRCAGQQISYTELDRRSNQLARHLQAAGVTRESRVGLCLERSLELIIGILGIHKAGGAYLPIDPGYPAERIAHMQADAQPEIILSDSNHASRFQDSTSQVIRLDSDWPRIATRSSAPLAASERTSAPDSLAYIIYTSGSTGQPKGVMIEHRQVTRLFDATQEWYRFNHHDRWSLFHSYAFDFSVWEIWGALLYGGQLIIVPQDIARDAQAFWQLIQEERITILNQTPSAFRQLIAAQALADQNQPPSHSLRQIIFGGEALEMHSLRPWIARNGTEQPQLINMYGITETTVHVSYRRLSREDIEQGQSSNIGIAIPDLKIHLLDEHQQPVPVGVAGEIHVGGDGVARGYYNRPELTAARFIPDPWGPPGARLYKSGDLARWRSNGDGSLEYLGRNDHQVKIRGFRIELGEIEAQLSRQAAIREAVVIARSAGDATQDKRLVAYLTLHEGQSLSLETLRSELKAGLPEYMVPAAFVVLDQLPLTAHGKLDARALPEPEAEAGEGLARTTPYAPPQGEVERTIAALWQDLLRVDQVGRHDNFFDLGGHSLMIVRMLEGLRQAGLRCEVRQVFDQPTPAGLAVLLSSAGVSMAAEDFQAPPNLIPADCLDITPSMLPLVQLTQAQIDQVAARIPGGMANIQDIYPLAPLQEGILFHHQLAAEGGQGDAYVLPMLLAFDGRARLEAFVDALKRIIGHHDILRTAIVWQGLAQPLQVVQRQVSLSLEWLSLPNTPELRVDPVQALRPLLEPGNQHMELQQAPLIRLRAVASPHDEQHYLVLQVHHIISDHQALEIVLGEIAILLQQPQATLPAQSPYRDFVAQALALRSRNDDAAFFRARLADIDEPTAPFGLVNVHGDGSCIAEAQQMLEPALSLRLRQVARRCQVSPAALFHAALALVLAGTSGRTDVVFGSVLSGRLQGGGSVGMGRALGMFINTLPLRFSLSGLRVRALVELAQRELIELLAHEQASLALASRCSRLPATTPLFSAVLNFRHSAEPAAVASTGIEVLVSQERTNYPFTVNVDDLGTAFRLDSQTDSRVEPMRVNGYLVTAIESLVTALEGEDDPLVLMLPMLPAAERHQLLEAYNATAAAYPASETLHSLIEAQVARTPHAIAAEIDGQQLSYTELDQRANQLAHWLQSQGIGPDQRVAISVERSLEMIIGLLGILKAGGAYVPVDPDYPAERIEYMLRDAAPRVILSQSALQDKLQTLLPADTRLLKLDSDWPEIARQPHTPPDDPGRQAGPQHLAYIIYTSGSTGQPKGAMNEHGAVVNRLHWMQKTYRLTADGSEKGGEKGGEKGSKKGSKKGGDRILQKTPFSFDVSVWEFFWPLQTGARLVFARPGGHQDPGYLQQIIAERRITTLHFVPSMLQAFLDWHSSSTPLPLDSLKRIIVSGEELPLALQERCQQQLPHVELHNLYGPTEAAIDVTWWPCQAEAGQSRVPIGRPIDNLRMYILDSQQQPVPLGVAGEIYIGGIGVGRGYLNRPELTAERFLPDPHNRTPGARMYRTGDVGRWRSNGDGSIEYLGRNDHQVKIRGLRIELGEIEAQLARHSGVRESVVLAREDRPGDKRLVGYITAQHGQVIDIESLKNELRQSLPEYMVPAVIVLLDEMPLSPNGKLERRALPAPEQGSGQAYAAPQGEIETAIAALWQDILGVERVGRHDDFFDLGGHSLKAMQLAARLGPQLRRVVAVRQVFEHSRLSDLAAVLAASAESDSTMALAGQQIPHAPSADYHPLSHAQRRLWFLAQIGNAQGAYNIPAAVRFQGRLDVDRLKQALNRLVERHAALRTTFIPMDGEPMQWVGAAALLVTDLVDASGMTLAEIPLTEFALQPFNLETGPLLRARIWRLAPQDYLLSIVVHHIVADGWSLELAVREVAADYRGESLPPLPIQYLDYACWQRERIESGALDGMRRYWLEQLGGELPMLQLPTDRPRPTVQSFVGGQHRQPLDDRLRAAIIRFCSERRLTPYMLLLAVYQTLLGRLSGQQDILVGVPLAGREHVQTGDLIGFFVNTLVMRADLSDDPSFVQHCERVRQHSLQAQTHQDYPFDLLVDQLNSRRDLSRQAVFDTTFTLETRALQSSSADTLASDIRMTSLPIDLPRAKFDLAATVAWGEHAAELMFEYSTELFDASTIERYAGYYLNLLEDALVHPDNTLSRLRLIDGRERDRLLTRYPGAARPIEVTDNLAARIGRMACQAPQAIALRHAGQSMSYGELEARANRLAHYLQAQGIGLEDAVVLCLERGFDMIVAILGVLKAGACYVPIEPGLPGERLRFLLQDSGARLIVSHGRSAERLGRLDDQSLPVLDLDEVALQAALAALPVAAPAVAIGPQNRAYIIYTSGSTGQPKGCQLTHANVLRLFAACETHFEFGATDAWTLFHSYAFDFSVWEIFGALLYGGRLVIVPGEVARSPADFAELLQQEGVTLLSQTPSAFVRLLEVTLAEQAGTAAVQGPHWGSCLRYVVFGGEALEYASLRPWYRQGLNPATRLINMYGITETTVHVTWRAVSAADAEAGGGRGVGRPLSDLTAYILDAHREPQPVGVTGELYIGGGGLARGYLNRPELTAERFIAHPFGENDARLYRTGDLARWSADGEIEYQGRIDHQVKIHGYRIELGEIETRLAQHAAVTVCLVMAVNDPRTLQDRLVAYYSASEALGAGTLRSWLGQTLPDYMIPHSFVQVERMPLTVNGKIDRSKLQTNFAMRPQLEVPYVVPETPLELRLARIWSETLGVDRVGLRDNFFDLGGDSFSAYRLMTRISDELDRDLALESIFRTQTIADMARELEQGAVDQEESSLVLIQAGFPGQIPFFCAHQAGGDVLSFQSLARALGPDRPFYGVQSAGRLLGESQHHTLEEMCADYLRDIRAVQPHGPYLLGGHSMGGKVAYELARQLEAAGEVVGVLAILDSDIINKNTSMLDSMMLLSETFRLNLKREELACLEPRHMMDFLLTAGKKRFARVLEIAYDMDLLPRGFRTRDAEMFLNRIATNIHVSDAYVAPPIHTPVSLFLATDHTENSYIIDVDAWREVALGGLEVFHVAGNHLNLIQKPHVEGLAAILAVLIEKTERTESTPNNAADEAVSQPA